MRHETQEHTFVLAVDPGGNTGLAWLIDDEFGSQVATGGRFGFHDWFTKAVAKVATPNVVICEDFIITSATARKTAQPDPHRIIGWLELWCYQHGVPFILQTPSQAKGFGTDAKLKFMGYYRAGNGGHDNDAARHLLTYCAVRGRQLSVLNRLKEFV